MSAIETILLSLLVFDALALTVLVLLQQGKGADVGAAFGSGSANTMFGSGGSASFLTKMTTWLAIGFFVIAFALAYTAKQRADGASSLGIPQVQNSESASDVEPGVDSLPPANENGDIPSDVPSSNDDLPDL